MNIIIGAGPVGCHAAYKIAKSGKPCIVIEEHKEIGKPIQCTGIVTKGIEETAGLSAQEIDRVTAFNAERTTVSSPNGKSAEIKLKGNRIVFRDKFDSMLAKRAEGEGAKILRYHKFLGFYEDGVLVLNKEEGKIHQMKADCILGADGQKSIVAEKAGLTGNQRFVYGAQKVIRHKHNNDIQFYPHIGVISWIVPEGPNSVRAGICSYENPEKEFGNFLDTFIGKDHAERTIESQGGLIPIFDPGMKTETKIGNKRIMLIGDAAKQVKPTTFGGLIQGISAANAASQAINTGRSYEKLWRKKLEKDLKLGLRIRNMMDKFSENDYNELVRLFNNPKIQEIFAKHDRDYPSKFLAKTFIAEPRLILLAFKTLF